MTPILPSKPVVIAHAVVPSGPEVMRPVAGGKPVTVASVSTGRVWSGEGPPTDVVLPGFVVGETYIDTLSGNIYRLDPGE